MSADFSHVRHWVFDLDNTLYPPTARLFDLINIRMTAYVMEELGLARDEADHLRKEYYHNHGTTLAGLIREHDIDPDPYLDHVHDIALDRLSPDPELRAAITALPGRRIIYTNGTKPYAERVIAARGLEGIFDAIYGVEEAGLRSKPDALAFETIFELDGLETSQAAMFEDESRNLAVPHDLGMVTTHVAPARDDGDHIHHHADDLTGFLNRLMG